MSQKIEYRHAQRVLVLLAREEDTPFIAAFKPSIGVSAQTLIALQDQVHAIEQVHAASSDTGDNVASLFQSIRGWSMTVRSRVPSLPHLPFGSSAMVPEDALAIATKLVKSIDTYEAENEITLDFSQALRDELVGKMAALDQTLTERGIDRASLGELRVQLAEVSTSFRHDLISFRKAIAALLGKSHVDYRRLRAIRGAAKEEDEGDEPETASEPSASVESNVGT